MKDSVLSCSSRHGIPLRYLIRCAKRITTFQEKNALRYRSMQTNTVHGVFLKLPNMSCIKYTMYNVERQQTPQQSSMIQGHDFLIPQYSIQYNTLLNIILCGGSYGLIYLEDCWSVIVTIMMRVPTDTIIPGSFTICYVYSKHVCGIETLFHLFYGTTLVSTSAAIRIIPPHPVSLFLFFLSICR